MNEMASKQFYANGKLLITAEYLVLDGAKALALPTRFGQSLHILPLKDENIIWKSFDVEKNIWFEGIFDAQNFDIKHSTDSKTAEMLQKIFQTAQQLPKTGQKTSAYWGGACCVETRLTFPRNWGLGSSSTLIAMFAEWCDVDKYALLAATFGGSGYDLACAMRDNPIFYNIGNPPIVENIIFNPPFSSQLFFVYLGKKQNSREGIARYRSKKLPPSIIADFSDLTVAFSVETDFSEFQKLMKTHEQQIQKIIDLTCVKDLFFADFDGEIKSLGAWGGDFVMVASNANEAQTRHYFKSKGFDTLLTFSEMIKY
ncbi:MAG: hypothetical protein RL757_2445 [Bacteroidota bacterium]|jgi:mevalonate kinase